MEKVIPDVYRKYTPYEYQREFERIEKEIKQMDDVDFEIIVNTDIPFKIGYLESWKRPFSDLLQQLISTQKQVYIGWLENIFMFHNSMFQRN
ncbi:hypothetical protein [Epilithonimonas lactis]|uniref:Uncharacterized protein n=1 Tax=Epilithonimonas lactis TaxID=421072 RepID=A0A085BER1_9FLAO|nr:hypothetical protein [Epilithonimonas lactis]KFC20956.1 hypothetical protein IO89_12045 [Epilithonimonas lactis]SEP67801.1 hypothetical protein SAMN04488097_0291 [Epilithonimonas lactis]